MKEDKAHLLKRCQLKKKELEKQLAAQAIQLSALRRQAQIEVAMERVRARAMAMYRPDELVEVAILLRKEMGLLGVEELETSSIYIHNKKTGKTECWFSIQDRNNENNLISDHMTIDLQDTWVGRQMLEFYNSEDLKTSIVMQGANRTEWITYCAEKSELFSIEGFYGEVIPDRTYHLYKFNNGYIGAAAPGDISAESWDLLKRATAVFSLAFTRFNDLQKAEAQTREAQVEAALERVRARSMAMQESEELEEVIKLLYDQFVQLNIFIEHTGFIIDYRGRDDMLIWLADQNAIQPQVTIPYFDSPHWNSFNEAKEKGNKFFANNLNFEEKNNFYKQLFIYIPDLPEDVKEYYFNCPGLAISTVLMDNVGLYIENFSGIPYSDEENSILMRFGKVFQQAYTRFLDLKKAEAQAREAQIETALERIRASSLAMHKSEELAIVARTVFEQLTVLGMEVYRSWIDILYEEEGYILTWSTDFNGKFQSEPATFPIDNDETMSSFLAEFKSHSAFIELEAHGSEVNHWFEYLYSKSADPIFTISEIPKDLYQIWAKHQYGTVATTKLTPVTAAEKDVLARFAKVFEQAYTRFLDLQKAEAQAREAQIEAALERVRAKSMAMHKSEELADLSLELVAQVQKLGIATWFCAFNIYDDDEQGSLEWGSNGQGVFPKYRTPREGIFLHYYETGQSGETFLVYEIDEEACPAHYEYLCSLPGVGEQLLKMKAAGLSFPSSQIDHVAYFKYGYILFITFEPVPEAHDIFKRFAKVFEQTYTRFLDLQKAEALAREAQIELSLERIRAEAMAMKRSEDLLDIVVRMRSEFISLGHEAHYFWHMKWAAEKYHKAMTSGDGTRIGMVMELPRRIHGEIPSLAAWEKSDEPTTVHVMDVEATLDYVHKMVEWGDFKRVDPNMPSEDDLRHIGGLTYVMARTMHGEIGYSLPGMVPNPPDEAIKILQRFADTFDLAYRRFEDLQRAEEQAREAQIEAALERTRAQSMMMQHSDELNATSNVFHEQLLLLGLPSEFSYVWLPDEPSQTHLFWATWSENLPADEAGKNGIVTSRSKACTYPLDKTEPYTAACFEMWKGEEDVFVNRILPEEVEGFFATWSELVSEADNLKAENFTDGLYYAEAYMKYGCFGINIRRPLDDAEKEVLRRFANEFERTYTRFLDLQTAEEQAHRIKLVNRENERLLHSILPQPIAEQIRTGQQNVVKRFDQVSILFADIVGFTILSEKLKPGKVVDILNGLFSKFDDLTDEYGLEKIKTIGDAYMVAAGVPEERADHAMTIFRFAQDMLRALEEYNQTHNSQLNLRIGISSGPVVAGVIGKKKFAYDLWGDSVNTAARMEAYGREGKIQVSPASYELLKNDFPFEKVPEIHIKGKGLMDVYLWTQ